jgi:hypothetical protein
MLDRLALFFNFLKKFRKIQPKKLSLIAFILCTLINVPELLSNNVETLDEYSHLVQSDDYFKYHVYKYCDKMELFKTKLGDLLVTITYILREFILTTIDLSLNATLLINYLKYMRKKRHQSGSSFFISKSNANLVLMTIILSFISIICYSYSSIIRYTTIHNQILSDLTFGATFSVIIVSSIKESLNFFIFYLFNQKFRESVVCLNRATIL